MGDVLTWVWQGSLVALLLAVALRAAPVLGLTGAARYAICWLGLGVVLALPLVPAAQGALDVVATTASPAGRAAAPETRETLTLPAAPPSLVSGLLVAWMLTVVANLARLAVDVRDLLRMKRRARPMPLSTERRLPLWRHARKRGRRVRLAMIEDRLPAAALGFRRPMIVIPRALVEALAPAELDQVVAHEHAHVERRDDWANLLQRVIAVPFGLHPAVWLIGRWIRRERELAADERVALRTGAPRAYARCLARVAEAMAWPAAPRLASGTAGPRGEMARRVSHLLDARWVRARRPSRWMLGAAGGLATVAALLLGGQVPGVEFGAGNAAATRVRVAPPPSPAATRARVALAGAAGGRGAERAQRVPGVRLPSPPAREPLAATRLLGRPVTQGPHPTARPRGLEERYRSRALLAAHDLDLSAPHGLMTPVEGIGVTRESRWAWAGRTGSSLGSWFAGAGRTTAGTFRSLGSSLTRTFTGRR